MAKFRHREPRWRRLPRAFWGGVAGAAATAVAVELTRTGLDILVLVVVGLIVILVERTVGDWMGELLGSGLTTLVLGTTLAAVAWVLFEEGGPADRFFAAAEERGYRTSYYEVPGQPPPPKQAVAVASTGATPAPSPNRTSRAGSTAQRSPTASGPAAGESPQEPSPTNGDSNPAAWLLGSRLATTQLILRVPTPAMTGERIQVRARLTSDSRPVAGVPIDFTANSRPIATATTNHDGVATATFSADIVGRYHINALFRNDGRMTQSSASALLIVLQGRS